MIRVALVYLCCWLVAATSSVKLCRVRSILPNINIYISTHIYIYNIYTYLRLQYLHISTSARAGGRVSQAGGGVQHRVGAGLCPLLRPHPRVPPLDVVQTPLPRKQVGCPECPDMKAVFHNARNGE